MTDSVALCPKCARERAEADSVCSHCGVIFSKAHSSQRVIPGPPQTVPWRKNRFRILAVASYGLLSIGLGAVFFWYFLHFTDGWHGETDELIWTRVIPGSLLAACGLGFVAMNLTPRDGETGQGLASAPFFLAFAIAGLLVIFLGSLRIA